MVSGKQPVLVLVGRRISTDAYVNAIPDFPVRRRANGFESLLLEVQLDDADVIVIELAVGGLRLLQQLRKRAPQAHLVAIVESGNNRAEALNYGADLVLEAPSPRDLATRLAPFVRTPRKNVALVVEDDEASRDLMEELLVDAGFDVITARDGREALTKVDSKMPDVAILDLRMPGMGGVELCRALRARKDADVPVLFVSATDMLSDKLEAFHAGASDFLSKPIDEERLVRKLRTMLDLSASRSRLENLGRR